MIDQDWKTIGADLESLLKLQSPPLAITFSDSIPATPRFAGPAPEPGADGRTGKVSAGCVFWMEAANKTFSTLPEDHANCSVGSMTHGLKTLEEVAGNADIAALLESGWVTMEMVPGIATIKQKPAAIIYGPLAETEADPDVVFMRLNAKQVMVLHDAFPNLRFEGKPQCHIIAIAKESGEPAVSVGCMLSRVRTGMSNNEMTCAIPSGQVGAMIQRLKSAASADNAVAAYASEDAKRFGR